MQNVVRSLPVIGGVGQVSGGVPWLVFFPDGVVHEGAAAWFGDLAASDLNPASFRSYGYDLLRWFRPQCWQGETAAIEETLIHIGRNASSSGDR